MRIDGIELRVVTLPLVSPFVTSFGTQTERTALLVRAVADGVEGWGECVALPEPVYSSEYVVGALDVIERFLGPALLKESDLTAGRVGPVLHSFVGHRIAKAALEMAILDAQLRSAEQSFADYLGVTKDRVPSGVSVGIQPSIADLVTAVGGYLDEGYQRIKIKIKPGWDIEPVKALRAEFGEIPLQVDANSAYTLDDVAIFQELDDYGLLLIEQPLYEDDIRLHSVLARMISTPICLDESIVSARAAADAIALNAAQIINIKPGRVGGYLEAMRIHELAYSASIPVWCGGMLETGIARGANAALAALPGFTLPGDISGSDRFYREDITEPFVLEDGFIRVPTVPGIARLPIMDRLEEVTVSTRWIGSDPR
ncbi:o-succinylbenzoate synthase [Naasia lichenicola]|uniref:o-succinylbenzoate synthase n=1 Tax=Naasia lichenicola TaxID=2565933 RepID=A0A4V6RYY9_9MICO|nr:o-succinylbenzoate synthase [Naasia lichenicola]THG28547.1 o-succinylbenzoate synthase [Naasia lichenicola]